MGRCFLSVMSVLLCCSLCRADVALPAVFGEHMVLQRQKPVPVWGTAEPGEDVSVSFNGQTKATKAGADGKWRVDLDAMEALQEGAAFTVKGKNEIVLNDVLVGEVWLCSGQSNMQIGLAGALNGPEEVKNADFSKIRLLGIAGVINITPQTAVAAKWAVCNPQTAGGFSAVGYFFGRELHKKLNVPVGLIRASWGGSRIEPFTPLEGFLLHPEAASLTPIIAEIELRNPASAKGKAAYEKSLADIKAWLANAEAAVAVGKHPPEMPLLPNAKLDNESPCMKFNAMINPLIPFALRGAIWYQGESNAGEGISYLEKTRALVEGWRKLWGQDLSFYYVQLAGFSPPTWPAFREIQTQCLSIPKTGMALAIDVGNNGDIHPKNKQDVGYRLAQWALAKDYGQAVPFSGPAYKSLKIDGGKAIVSFEYAEGGLIASKKNGLEPVAALPEGKLDCFQVAGSDKKWVAAEAVIAGETVVVSSEAVKEPVAVRYLYIPCPTIENSLLYSAKGQLPAVPFRTDDWK